MLRAPQLRTASLALPLALALVVSACSGGGDKSSTTTRRAGTTTTSGPVTTSLGAVHIESAGPPVKLDAKTQQALLVLTNAYVDSAIISPLRNGKIGAKYAALFDGNVQHQAGTTDREALTDLSVGKVKNLKTQVTPVRIEGIADQAGRVLYLATIFQVNTAATTANGPVTVNRSAELTFAPSPRVWKVTAYRTLTTRKAPAGTTTTTASSGGSPTTKTKP